MYLPINCEIVQSVYRHRVKQAHIPTNRHIHIIIIIYDSIFSHIAAVVRQKYDDINGIAFARMES